MRGEGESRVDEGNHSIVKNTKSEDDSNDMKTGWAVHKNHCIQQ